MGHLTRRGVLLAVGSGVTALSGCLRDGPDASDRTSPATSASATGRGSGGSTSTSTVDPSTVDLPTGGATLPMAYSTATLREETLPGGPPKDGIPAIDNPNFSSVKNASAYLSPDTVVFGVERGDVVKAYPQNVLVWHEIVNDVLDGDPVSVTYCPLTGTTIGFERGETTFGVSGDLVNSNLVMYDRATDSRWPQVLATAISGPFEGQTLEEFQVVWTTWERWQSVHPDTLVMTEETGYARNYSRDPYGTYTPRSGYYASDSTLFPPLAANERFGAKETVIGTRSAGVHAFRKASLRKQGLVETDDLLSVYDPSLDTGYVYRNPDGLSFQYDNGTVSGPDGTYRPDELPLASVFAFDAMWFAWAGFYPDTAVHA